MKSKLLTYGTGSKFNLDWIFFLLDFNLFLQHIRVTCQFQDTDVQFLWLLFFVSFFSPDKFDWSNLKVPNQNQKLFWSLIFKAITWKWSSMVWIAVNSIQYCSKLHVSPIYRVFASVDQRLRALVPPRHNLSFFCGWLTPRWIKGRGRVWIGYRMFYFRDHWYFDCSCEI